MRRIDHECPGTHGEHISRPQNVPNTPGHQSAVYAEAPREPVEVSEPFQVRELKGPSKCLACQQRGSPCYIQQDRPQCLHCTSKATCTFRRWREYEGHIDQFRWVEVVGAITNEYTSAHGHGAMVGPSSTEAYTKPEALVDPARGSYAVNQQPPRFDDRPREQLILPAVAGQKRSWDALDQSKGRPNASGAITTMNHAHQRSDWTEPSQPEWRCKICDKSFDQEHSWRRHLARHERAEQYHSQRPARTLSVANITPSEPPASHGQPLHCHVCSTSFKTKAEWSKHMSRHEKHHRCQFPGCSRRDGFATANDLERHVRAVHGQMNAEDHVWKCFVPDCKSADKIWPRQDNFKAHVARMHKDEDVDKWVRRSDQWLEQEEKPRRRKAAQANAAEGNESVTVSEHKDRDAEATRSNMSEKINGNVDARVQS